MSVSSQNIWTLLSFWHKSLKGSILLEIGEEAIKYNYFDLVKVDFGQWKKEILFVIEFGYPACEASDVIGCTNIGSAV